MKEMTLKQIQKELGYEVKIVAELEKPQSKVWKPYVGQMCWFVNASGNISNYAFSHSGEWAWRLSIGNCFKTEREAEFYKEKLLVTAELQRFADEHNDTIKIEKHQGSTYYFYYQFDTKRIAIGCSTAWNRYFGVFFSSSEIAKKAIDTIGEERIKKYYLEVQE